MSSNLAIEHIEQIVSSLNKIALLYASEHSALLERFESAETAEAIEQIYKEEYDAIYKRFDGLYLIGKNYFDLIGANSIFRKRLWADLYKVRQHTVDELKQIRHSSLNKLAVDAIKKVYLCQKDVLVQLRNSLDISKELEKSGSSKLLSEFILSLVAEIPNQHMTVDALESILDEAIKSVLVNDRKKNYREPIETKLEAD